MWGRSEEKQQEMHYTRQFQVSIMDRTSKSTSIFCISPPGTGIKRTPTISAGTGRLRTGDPSRNNRCSATDSGGHRDRLFGAVLRAGAAFHAEVPVEDSRCPVFHSKYAMRANLPAHPASCARVFVQPNRRHTFQISKPFHNPASFQPFYVIFRGRTPPPPR
ncbi:MAG: hypothetical protein HW377_975 [Actinobacteria bacterium]|nr:hypothetical protein [Actinomycetota bacterium]MBM2827973.1 hypothetical protein [Actinomycetota bacterium]